MVSDASKKKAAAKRGGKSSATSSKAAAGVPNGGGRRLWRSSLMELDCSGSRIGRALVYSPRIPSLSRDIHSDRGPVQAIHWYTLVYCVGMFSTAWYVPLPIADRYTDMIESLSLTFHGHDLIVDSELELNYGRYYMSALEAVFNCDEERLRLEKEAETIASSCLSFADLEACVWLEESLKKLDRILVVVSHSQDFLNGVCTNIIHMQNKNLKFYSGNYDQYVQTRAELEENQMKQYKWEQEQIASMEEYIARFGHGSAKLARQAQSKEKTLAKMERDGLTEKVVKDKVLVFRFADVGKLPPPVLQFVGVTFGYTPDNLIYQNLDFGVDLDSRIALVGPNGAGKSTLLKLMTGDLIPLDGMVRRHNHLRIAQFHQHLAEKLDLEMPALQYMTGNEEERMRSAIGKFGLSGIHFSGSELRTKRVFLAQIVWSYGQLKWSCISIFPSVFLDVQQPALNMAGAVE
ncbi:hypothetical protein BHM03_00050573 [Ensete ventricosum]|nr:hypothetical protein BHM03_00050573 [Ensete ventricosum]